MNLVGQIATGFPGQMNLAGQIATGFLKIHHMFGGQTHLAKWFWPENPSRSGSLTGPRKAMDFSKKNQSQFHRFWKKQPSIFEVRSELESLTGFNFPYLIATGFSKNPSHFRVGARV